MSGRHGRLAQLFAVIETGVSGVYKQFVYRPSGDMLAVYSSGLVKGTLPLPGGEAAVYNASGLSFLRHKDWLGSSRLSTTWTHTVYSKVAYAPFGETYNESGSTPDRSFTGQDQNVDTGPAASGVYDYLFRKYDPSAGRWLSPDPLGWGATTMGDPQSLNRYAYVENQPMSYIDPNGEWLCFAGGGVSSGTQVSPGFTCWSDGFGYNVMSDSANNFTFNDDGTITAKGIGFAGYWSQIDVLPAITLSGRRRNIQSPILFHIRWGLAQIMGSNHLKSVAALLGLVASRVMQL
ncbi:MAG TPA: RHS repeat-associated core domain-containing protein [Terracidiphilus sp.]|nr:RHS repeat-associated core domain-containing protein [Terracidiphilus sp.]